MNEQLEKLMKQALYAGYKYHLCVKSAMGELEEGYPPTIFDTTKLGEYYDQWAAYTRQAVELHQQLEGEES